MNVLYLLLFTGLTLTGFAHSATPEEDAFLAGLNIKKKIIYKTVDGRKLDLWLFLPKQTSKTPMPIMLHTHGGGWSGGNKLKIIRSSFRGTLEQLLKQGVACASIEYRLCGKTNTTAIECVQDCKDAARFLIANATEYNIDPERMGLWGGSAGGHLALMTGLASNETFKGDEKLAAFDPQFRCIASYFPATTFIKPELFKGSTFEAPEKLINILGGLAKDFPERATLLSPTEHLHADSPPIMLLHGQRDNVLPFALSEHFVEVAKQKGATVTLLPVKNAAHSFGGKKISPSIIEINQRATEFILKHLHE